MNFIMWLAVGIFVGSLANLLMGALKGIFLDIIVGIVGAFVGGLLVTFLGISPINQNPFNLLAMLVAIGGAVILLAVLNLFRWRGYGLS